MDEGINPQAALAAALSAAQAEIQDPGKNRKGQVKGKTDYRYAGLDELLASVRPALSKHGLAVSQAIEYRDGKPYLVSSLLHSGGGERRSEWQLAAGSDPQARGSELTYARRYTLEGLVGVAPTEGDDDGKAAADNSKGQSPDRTKESSDVKQARQDQHDPDWDRERGAFMARLCGDPNHEEASKRGLGFSYDEACGFLNWMGRPRPSHMTSSQREGMLKWLASDAGAEKYAEYLSQLPEPGSEG